MDRSARLVNHEFPWSRTVERASGARLPTPLTQYLAQFRDLSTARSRGCRWHRCFAATPGGCEMPSGLDLSGAFGDSTPLIDLSTAVADTRNRHQRRLAFTTSPDSLVGRRAPAAFDVSSPAAPRARPPFLKIENPSLNAIICSDLM
jgi:hypothetical protein